MSQMLSFNLTLPKEMLDDLAENVHGVEGVQGLSPAGVIGMIEDLVSIGLEEHLGESDDFMVQPAGPGSFNIQVPDTALADVALNVANIDSIEGMGSDDVCKVMDEIVMAGLDELLGYSEGFNLRAI